MCSGDNVTARRAESEVSVTDITERLLSMQDTVYRDFNSSLIPTVDKSTVIGVRTPLLRRLARELGDRDKELFLSQLPHRYYEENNLHAFIICNIRNFDDCVTALDAFLPYVDNWATCDSMRPKCFGKSGRALLPYVDRWLSSSHTYTIRYAIGMLLSYFLDGEFDESILERVSAVDSDEYYVRMMSAWFFATALAKQWESALPYIADGRLPVWEHNKTIQKAVESYRITPEQKEYLRGLRRKN